MKFAIANASFWEGLGYDTTHWRKSADGNEAIIDLAYAEILGQNLHKNPAVAIYNADSVILEEILLSQAWANAALNGTYDSVGVLDQVAQFESNINSRIAEILAGILQQNSGLYYEAVTQAEYDALTAAGTLNPYIFYEITDQEDAVYDELGALLTSVTTATTDMVTLHDTVSDKLLAGEFDGAPGPQGVPGATGPSGTPTRAICFYVDSTLAWEAGVMTFIVPMALSITDIRLTVDVAPVGAALLVDIHKNGTTLYTTQANRPTIAAGTYAATAALPDVVSLALGDKLTLDIDQVGLTTPGENLSVLLVCAEG